MFHVKNHKQLDMFDSWAYLGEKRRRELDKTWSGLFRSKILQTLPVEKLRKHYHANNGRPTKELYSMLGLMILQQMHDLTDEQTVEQFSFNIKWHYALDITSPADATSYVSLRSIWEMRRIFIDENLYVTMFNKIAKKLEKVFKVDLRKQRLDSVHVRSNMRHLGRISLFSKTIKKFLVNLKRQHRPLFDSLDSAMQARYLNKKEEAIFSLVKPSESSGTLNQLAQDIYSLVERFKARNEVNSMDTFKLLVRLFQEQCLVEEQGGDKLILAKPNKDVPSDSLQNPSDPDAGYSGHKGKGYSVQVMETYSPGSPDSESKNLSLITHIAVNSANNSDAHALIPALTATQSEELIPEEVLVDTLYGSDDNVTEAKATYGVDVVSPLKNQPEGLSLADFSLDDSGHILKCPQGKSPVRVQFKKRFSASFGSECQACSQLRQCPVIAGKKATYYRYTLKDVRIAKRRAYERSDEFREKYRYRAGVEATMSEYDRRTGVKKLRFRGLAAVRFAAFMKAIGINIKRAAACEEWQKKTDLCQPWLFALLFYQIVHFKEQLQARFQNFVACTGRFRPCKIFSREFAC